MLDDPERKRIAPHRIVRIVVFRHILDVQEDFRSIRVGRREKAEALLVAEEAHRSNGDRADGESRLAVVSALFGGGRIALVLLRGGRTRRLGGMGFRTGERDVFGAGPVVLLALADFEGDRRVGGSIVGSVPSAFERRDVNEQVGLAFSAGDEAEAFAGTEELDFSVCHSRIPLKTHRCLRCGNVIAYLSSIVNL